MSKVLSRNPMAQALIRTLHEEGIEDFIIEQGGKHPRLRFLVCGRRVTYVFPKTPGERRSQENNVSRMRKSIREARAIPVPT